MKGGGVRRAFFVPMGSGLNMVPFESLGAAAGFGLPGEVGEEYAGYGFSAAVERCHPPMIERMF